MTTPLRSLGPQEPSIFLVQWRVSHLTRDEEPQELMLNHQVHDVPLINRSYICRTE